MPAKSRRAAKIPAAGDNLTPSTSAKPIKLGELIVEPISIGHFWLLQEIESPLLGGSDKPIGMKDVAAAVLILTDGQGAQQALQKGRPEFDRLAYAAASRVPAADLGSVATILAGTRPNRA